MSIFFEIKLYSQDIVPSITNFLRFGTGERELGAFGAKQTYFENLSDIRLILPGNFIAGFRLLYDSPPEMGEPFTGIKRRFIEYNKDEIYLRAGNSSELFGRGLALNLFENRGLAYDTWLDGIKGSYTDSLFKVTIIGGIVDFRDSITVERNERYRIIGGNIEIFPFELIKFGASFISAEGLLRQGNDEGIPSKNINAEVPELYLSVSAGNFFFYIDWSNKRTDVTTDKMISTGRGLYSSLSFSWQGFGITLDYKNYLFDSRDPYGRFDNSRATRMLPFQNPPIVQREHSYTLLSRALHEVDFNDEVGFQVEAFYSPDDNSTITLNTCLASIHNNYILNNDGFTFIEVKRKGNYFPSTRKEFFPYYEIYLEGEYYYSLTSAIRGGYALREKKFFNEFSLNKSSIITRSIVVPLQIQHSFNNNFSVTLQSEHEWVKESSTSANLNFFNHLVTAIASLYSELTLAIRYEYTTTESDLSGRKNWLLGEAGYRLGQSHVISLSYGKERGGQICSNGVCRYIQPFNGFRLSMLSQL